ncbi:MAG: hypothetical protein Q8M19_09955 [Reyranella sp.]|nr:hypothetical protein [Reyranella sp.]
MAQSFVQSVSNVGQSGGLSAHTVNASSINLHGGPPVGQVTHQRQIQAVESLWQIVLNLGSEFSLAIFIDTILLPQEIDAHLRGEEDISFMDAVAEYRDSQLPLRKFANAGANNAAKERPFVSHRLWSIYFVVQAVYGRTALLLANSFKEGRFVNWREDGGCDQLLRAILPVQSVEHVKKLETNGLRTALDLLEAQFLLEAGMNKPQA